MIQKIKTFEKNEKKSVSFRENNIFYSKGTINRNYFFRICRNSCISQPVFFLILSRLLCQMIFVLFCLQTEIFKKHSVFILWLKCSCSSNCLQMYNIYKLLPATAVCPGAMSYRQPHWPCCCSHAKFIKKERLVTFLCRDTSFQSAQEVENPQVPLVPQPPRIPAGLLLSSSGTV